MSAQSIKVETPLFEAVEALVTENGLIKVLDALQEVCDYKSNFFQGQNEDLVSRWAGRGWDIACLSRKCRERGPL